MVGTRVLEEMRILSTILAIESVVSRPGLHDTQTSTYLTHIVAQRTPRGSDALGFAKFSLHLNPFDEFKSNLNSIWDGTRGIMACAPARTAASKGCK